MISIFYNLSRSHSFLNNILNCFSVFLGYKIYQPTYNQTDGNDRDMLHNRNRGKFGLAFIV